MFWVIFFITLPIVAWSISIAAQRRTNVMKFVRPQKMPEQYSPKAPSFAAIPVPSTVNWKLIKVAAALVTLLFALLNYRYLRSDGFSGRAPELTKADLLAAYENTRFARCSEWLDDQKRRDTIYTVTLTPRNPRHLVEIPTCHTLDSWQDTTKVGKGITYEGERMFKYFYLLPGVNSASFRAKLISDLKL